MSTKNPFASLAAAELAAALAPVQKALSDIASGDGSAASVTGSVIALQGEFIAALPVLKKIGFTTLAADLNQIITDFVAKQAADAATPSPAPEKAE